MNDENNKQREALLRDRQHFSLKPWKHLPSDCKTIQQTGEDKCETEAKSAICRISFMSIRESGHG